MKLITINDCHIGGPHQIHSHDEILYTLNYAQYPVAYLGDNYDVANCKRDEVWKIISQKKLIYTKMRQQDVFCRGNHGLNCIHAPDSHFKDGILFEHGDYLFWGNERADKFRSQKPGAGWFKRNLITRPLDSLRWLKDPHLNDTAKRYIDALPSTIHTIICGHRHPTGNIVEKYNGRSVLILKRGIQTIDLENV